MVICIFDTSKPMYMWIFVYLIPMNIKISVYTLMLRTNFKLANLCYRFVKTKLYVNISNVTSLFLVKIFLKSLVFLLIFNMYIQEEFKCHDHHTFSLSLNHTQISTFIREKYQLHQNKLTNTQTVIYTRINFQETHSYNTTLVCMYTQKKNLLHWYTQTLV